MKLACCIVMGDHGRTQTMKRARSVHESNKLNHLGWIKLDGSWYRGPDTWLVDLSDYLKVQKYSDPVTNLAYFQFIKDLVDNGYFNQYITEVIQHDESYRGFDCALSTGNVLETEYRLLGMDKRLYPLKDKIFNTFNNSRDGSNYKKRSQLFLGNTRDIRQNNIAYQMLDKKVKRIFEEIQSIYAMKGENIKFNSQIIPDIAENLPAHDSLVLVPKGCFRYLISLINNSENVNFLELHTGKKDSRYLQYFKESLKGKRVIIADTAYTGDTINAVSENILNNGGVPIKMGLFPKNREVINKLDYFVFGNRVFRSKEAKTGKDWYLQQYKEVFSLDK